MCNVLEITCRKYPKGRQTTTTDTIDRVDATLNYDDFYSRYLIPNKPCIFDASVTENWPCRKLWNADNVPDFDAVGLLFGPCIVPVVDCNKKYYNSQFKMDMKLADYLSYWKDHGRKNCTEATQLLYLKDWHCKKQFPNTPTYETPHYFSSDWLNEYYTAKSDLDDDYMFVYMGPKGTWTPLHVDVLTSYSWSANIVGRKRWLLYPPGQEDFLRDTSGQLIYDATSTELSNSEKYKAYDKRIVKYIDIIQEAGEIIFIPSGWHHQVWNVEDAISVNHNWINACNIVIVWQGLKKELSAVMREVEDCKDMSDWSSHCQLMLRTSCGLDYLQFFDFISFIAYERLRIMSDHEHHIPCSKKFTFSLNHCLFDLDAIRIVLMDLITEANAKSIYSIVCPKQEAHKLLNKIISLLQLQYSKENV